MGNWNEFNCSMLCWPFRSHRSGTCWFPQSGHITPCHPRYLHTHSRTRKQYAPGLFVAIQKFHLAGAHKKKKDKEIRTRTNSPARIDWLSCLHYSLLGAMLHCPSTSQVPPSPISPVAGTLRRCNQLHGVPPALSIGPRQSRLHRFHLPFLRSQS